MKERKEVNKFKQEACRIKALLEKRFPDIGFGDGLVREKDSVSFFFALVLKPEGEEYTWGDIKGGRIIIPYDSSFPYRAEGSRELMEKINPLPPRE